MKKWFTHEKCAAFEIRKYKSAAERHTVARREVLDPEATVKLMRRIAALPPEGDERISFGRRASQLDLVFRCGDHHQTISFYNGMIKTPSSGFYAQKNEAAEKMFEDLEGLLMGAYGKSVLLVKDSPQPFPDFTLLFVGEEEHDDGSPTASATTRSFLLTPKKGPQQKLTVTFGQVPPQPYPFKLGSARFTLFMYQSPTGEELFPERFLIAN